MAVTPSYPPGRKIDLSRDQTLTCLRQSPKIDFFCAWYVVAGVEDVRDTAAVAGQRGAWKPVDFDPRWVVHIVSRCARILAIRAEPDLNAENSSIIVVGDVLNNQERCHEHGHSGSDIK